jgi:hypothetical protein
MKVKKARFKEDYSFTIESYFGTLNEPYNKTAHNIHCTDEFAFISYYNDGLRIYDLRLNPPREVGAYDTYLDDENTNNYSMWGAWGIHALLPSGRILVSDRNTGFYMFDFDRDFFLNQASDKVLIYPNPVDENQPIVIRMPYDKTNSFSFELYDLNGKILISSLVEDQSFTEIISPNESGVYFLKITYKDVFGFEQQEVKKFIVR